MRSGVKWLLISLGFLLSLLQVSWQVSWASGEPENLVLTGYLPSRYVPKAKKGAYILSTIVVQNGIIIAIGPPVKPGAALPNQAWNSFPRLELKSPGASDYDVIYPGLINLHEHPKQNVLPLWADAKSQFQNRFEWRDWSAYEGAVAGNMNPWSSYAPAMECAAYRWSEIQQLVMGTGYAQGDANCVADFGIERIEDGGAFRPDKNANRLSVQAPTDLIIPEDMGWAWKHVMPEMLRLAKLSPKSQFEAALAKGVTYEQALESLVAQHCPGITKQVPNLRGVEAARFLGQTEKVSKECTSNDPAYGKEMISYLTRVHPGIISRKLYLNDPRATGVIAHLSEGRRRDSYNRFEWRLLNLFGLALPKLNLVHGVGLDSQAFAEMGRKHMGLIWSPFSNLLLYGETADILAAHKSGVTIALGSDWVPTGSRSVLEELKIAKSYVNAMATQNAGYRIFTDEYLYKMVTENPALMVSSLEVDSRDGWHGVGAIAVDALGTFSVFSKKQPNPYTNLVTAEAEDVKLVVIAGKPKYGNVSYLETYKKQVSKVDWEPIPGYLDGINQISVREVPAAIAPPGAKASSEEKQKYAAALNLLTIALASNPRLKGLSVSDPCHFNEPKALVLQKSGNQGVAQFQHQTGLNLELWQDVQKLIGISMLTHSKNAQTGNARYGLHRLPSLMTCGNPDEQARIRHYMLPGGEWVTNVRNRKAARQGLSGNTPRKLAEMYDQTYLDE